MRWVKSIAREVIGLFVDDGSFAAAILVWLVLAVVVLPRVAPAAHWSGPALFAGLALILIESALRFSRRRTKKRRPAKS
jgi:membrane protein implicated in regulation of membrane protease activity